MRYSTEKNNGVELEAAERRINYKLLTNIAAVFSLLDIYAYTQTTKVLEPLSLLNLSLTLMYFLYIGTAAFTLKIYNKCIYPTHIIIQSGKLVLKSLVYRREYDGIDYITIKELKSDKWHNSDNPIRLDIPKDWILNYIVLDKSELSKLQE